MDDQNKLPALKDSYSSRLSIPALLSILLSVLPLLTSSALTAWAISHETELRSWPLNTWVFATVALTLSSSLALTPPTFLALVYGYFLGWKGFPLLLGLNFGAITVIYYTSRLFNPPTLRAYLTSLYPKADLLLKRFKKNELRLIFFVKLSPVFPFAVTNMFFAVAGARLRQVLTGGTLGMVPRTILAIWAGKEAQDIGYLLDHPNEGLATKIVLIVLIIASTIGIGYFFKDKSAKSE